MDSSAYHLVKRDIDANKTVWIATYRVVKCGLEGGQRYVIFKNAKRVGWAMDEAGALQIHEMYSSTHFSKEDSSDLGYASLIKEIRSKAQDNSFLHNRAV